MSLLKEQGYLSFSWRKEAIVSILDARTVGLWCLYAGRCH